MPYYRVHATAAVKAADDADATAKLQRLACLVCDTEFVDWSLEGELVEDADQCSARASTAGYPPSPSTADSLRGIICPNLDGPVERDDELVVYATDEHAAHALDALGFAWRIIVDHPSYAPRLAAGFMCGGPRARRARSRTSSRRTGCGRSRFATTGGCPTERVTDGCLADAAARRSVGGRGARRAWRAGRRAPPRRLVKRATGPPVRRRPRPRRGRSQLAPGVRPHQPRRATRLGAGRLAGSLGDRPARPPDGHPSGVNLTSPRTEDR